jgi:hypothetical protein
MIIGMERDETADALQSDLEHREAALGRALSLLRTAWDLSANRWPLIEKLRTHHLLDALEWRDVQDWVIGEPREDDEPNTHYDRVSGLWTHLHWLSTHKRTVQGRWVFNHTRSEYAKTSHWSENMDDDETPQVMEVANPAERAAAGVDETLARWRGFSDDELRELRNGAIERYANIGVSSEQRARAGRLVTELRKVIEAREGETPSYRGPGRYRHHGGTSTRCWARQRWIRGPEGSHHAPLVRLVLLRALGQLRDAVRRTAPLRVPRAAGGIVSDDSWRPDEAVDLLRDLDALRAGLERLDNAELGRVLAVVLRGLDQRGDSPLPALLRVLADQVDELMADMEQNRDVPPGSSAS